MLALVLALIAQEVHDPPLLRVGETIEGEITDADQVVHTPTLDKGYTDAQIVGRTFQIEVEEPGPYTIELVSYLFDAYLVLRDEEGKVLAEDNDGGVGIHARITLELDAASLYLLDACALHEERGAFELDVHTGRPPQHSPEEERAAERRDLERTVEIREKALGPEHAVHRAAG